jgi:hypothetical protein
MLIDIKDLKEGDEIIVGTNGNLKYLRVLRAPQIGKKLHWSTNQPLYKAVKCSTRREDTQHQYGTRTYTVTEYMCTPENHNINIYQQLEGKKIWLVKRK